VLQPAVSTDVVRWVRLVRDASTHEVVALVSADGQEWEQVWSDIVPMLAVVHVGTAEL
jgi:hypothetical protein